MRLVDRHLSRSEIALSLAALAAIGWMLLSFLDLVAERGRLERTLGLLCAMERAVTEFHRDTGRYPIHLADYDPVVHPDLRPLTHVPPLESGLLNTGWKGPYLEDVAPRNAWGGLVHLHYSTRQFDLDGDGRADTAGSNSYLVLSAIPSRAAARLDLRVDGQPDPVAGRLALSPAAGGDRTVFYLIAD